MRYFAILLTFSLVIAIASCESILLKIDGDNAVINITNDDTYVFRLPKMTAGDYEVHLSYPYHIPYKYSVQFHSSSTETSPAYDSSEKIRFTVSPDGRILTSAGLIPVDDVRVTIMAESSAVYVPGRGPRPATVGVALDSIMWGLPARTIPNVVVALGLGTVTFVVMVVWYWRRLGPVPAGSQ